MTFEVFQRPKPRGRKPGPTPAVRVTGAGKSLYLNSTARKLMGNPDKVLLLRTDDGPMGIAIAAAKPSDPYSHAFPVLRGAVNCSRYIREMGLRPGEGVALRWEKGWALVAEATFA